MASTEMAPIQNQPAKPPATQWMPAPAMKPANCPHGLEYLTQVDQILVHQQMEMLEAFTGFETRNKYEIKNSMGQRIYAAVEESGCCNRQCCGPARPFEMQISDNNGVEIMHLTRPLRCTSCCCFCCLQKLEVHAPPGTLIGSVEQTCTLCKPKWAVKDAAGAHVLSIVGPCMMCNWCGDIEFQLQALDGTQIGILTKQWSGLIKEAFTDTDNFGLAFPLDLDVNVKATLMSAIFLLDFMYFENNTQDPKLHHNID